MGNGAPPLCRDGWRCDSRAFQGGYSVAPCSKPSENLDNQQLNASCVLAWGLEPGTHEEISAGQLEALHKEVLKHLNFFGAESVAEDATCGLVVQHSSTGADSLVRMAQLLCRWGLSQSPRVDLTVGLDFGKVSFLKLPSDRQRSSCYGPAVAGARKMVSNSRRQGFVHLTAEVWEQLSALRFLPMIVSTGQGSYYLDPFRDSDEGDDLEAKAASTPKIRANRSFMLSLGEVWDAELQDLLQTHRVDLSKFGKGNAKTLQQFYDSVVRDEKCYLQVEDGRLLRFVELVRKKPAASNGRGLSYALASKVVGGTGCAKAEKEAIEECFESKLSLSSEVQRSCFTVSTDNYSVEENTAESDTVPGIFSKYKAHSIVVSVKDRTREELKKIGLPSGADFSTENGRRNWAWVPVANDNKEDELMNLLQKYAIDVAEFSWQSFAELYDEVYTNRLSELQEANNELLRTVRIVKVWLSADILSCRHVLVMKTKQQRRRTVEVPGVRALSMRMRASQTWDDAAREVLFSKLGIEEEWMREGMSVTLADQFQEVELSQSFPGLKTVYVITEILCEVLNAHDPRWQIIGLPGGVDFTFARQRPVGQSGDIDTVIIRWGWTNAHDVEYQIALLGHRFLGKQPSLFDKSAGVEVMQNISNKVLAPEPLPVGRGDELLIKRILEGRTTDWVRARRAAAEIRNPNYSTKDFYADISAAFPELRLYRVERDSGKVKLGSTSASRTSDDEYQRTIGALFCIFWMMRLHLDGKECFCFGLDADWKPCRADSFPEVREAEFRKRKAFYDNTNWFAMEELLVGAGLLNQDRITYDVDRALTMLVLMSIHDIMKLDLLRPIATEDFRGYEAGDPISDHDVALSYVLERYPKALPSFAGLSHEQQSSIKFAHCKLEYNMGWLVQAEAPPGALFSSFREVVLSGEAKGSQEVVKQCSGMQRFHRLSPSDLTVLSSELALTGTALCAHLVLYISEVPHGEHHGVQRSSKFVFVDAFDVRCAAGWIEFSFFVGWWLRRIFTAYGGRFFLPERIWHLMLVCLAKSRYYAPALMQKAGRTAPFQAMHILAEVFRKARALWPLSSADADKTVVVRIDVLKDLEASAIVGTEGIFVLSKNSARDGQVRTMSPEELSRLDSKLNAVLAFGRACGLNLPGDDLVRTSLRAESRPRSKTPWWHGGRSGLGLQG
ncbi:MAP3K3 [Symbiodinium sp. KB8]|nr:MAP3K3 [Symbiodinium sp. KB8]